MRKIGTGTRGHKLRCTAVLRVVEGRDAVVRMPTGRRAQLATAQLRAGRLLDVRQACANARGLELYVVASKPPIEATYADAEGELPVNSGEVETVCPAEGTGGWHAYAKGGRCVFCGSEPTEAARVDDERDLVQWLDCDEPESDVEALATGESRATGCKVAISGFHSLAYIHGHGPCTFCGAQS